MAKIFIAVVTYCRDEQYLDLFLERLKRQDCSDWSLHFVDTTVSGNPALQSYAPRLKERLNRELTQEPTQQEWTVDEYATERATERVTESKSLEPVWTRVANARDMLRKQFLESDSKYLLFVDGDILLPPDALTVMLSDLSSGIAQVVSGAYLSVLTFKDTSLGHDVTKLSPVAWIKDAKNPAVCRPLLVIDVIPARKIKLFCGGFGCCLIARTVLERVAILPPVNIGATEDLQFYTALERFGIPVMLDTAVKCSHLRFPLGDSRNAALDFANYRLNIKKKAQ